MNQPDSGGRSRYPGGRVATIVGALAAAVIMTGVMFQLPHVAAVFGLLAWRQTKLVRSGAWIIMAGAFIFASVLDALALGVPRGVAAFAPMGGTLMMIGWLWIGLVALGGDRLAKVEAAADQSR